MRFRIRRPLIAVLDRPCRVCKGLIYKVYGLISGGKTERESENKALMLAGASGASD